MQVVIWTVVILLVAAALIGGLAYWEARQAVRDLRTARSEMWRAGYLDKTNGGKHERR